MSQLDQLWVLACAALVFLMQVGFMSVEAGLTRSKNNISVAVKNLTDFSIAFLLYVLIGYTLMYGPSVSGLVGFNGVELGLNGDVAGNVHLIFQAMFCGTAATILSGAVAERCAYRSYALITVVTVVLVYPVVGHWVWASAPGGAAVGWLGAIGFHDYAGAGVVHAVGGAVALAAIILIGPREGRFLPSGKARRFNGSDLPFTMLGVFLLWVGWLGFNGGSAMAFTDAVPGLLVNTLLGGAAGALAGFGVSWAVEGKPSVFTGMNGVLGGLVAVTAGCDLFTPRESIGIGAFAGVLVFAGDRLLERLRIDDAVGAVPVHFVNGLWGVLAVGIFGAAELSTGLGHLEQIGVQALGAGAIAVYAFGASFLVLAAVNHVMPLRVTQHVESVGLNVGEHGANTDLNELLDVMQRQARHRDLSIRAPQSPFTEVGQIGLFYNSVIYELEQAFSRVQTQSKELENALDQKNRILESVLPRQVAERMKAGEDEIVDQIADATVVFVDVVGFTEYSMESPPDQSINLLKRLFGAYDEVMKRHSLEKIKTIGDCYMFVAGLHKDETDHCAAALDAALDLLFETQQVGIALDQTVQVRIGVHSGPLVAGVVGEMRFVYDLWGSTVNLANRIEEAGNPNRITVSQAVIDRVAGEFTYERRGRPRLRGIGPTVLYEVRGRKQTAQGAQVAAAG